MLTLFGDPHLWLPLVFAGLMGVAILIYVVLDGYDLAVGLGAVSAASPLVSERIFDKWFLVPESALLAPLPVGATAVIILLWRVLRRLPAADDSRSWAPFVGAIMLNVLAFAGLAYSFYPYVVPERLTIYEAASAPESLIIILVGTLFVLPVIIGYSALVYRIFRGKATELR